MPKNLIWKETIFEKVTVEGLISSISIKFRKIGNICVNLILAKYKLLACGVKEIEPRKLLCVNIILLVPQNKYIKEIAMSFDIYPKNIFYLLL